MRLAIILARAGSKGVPSKNTRELGGRSLVARAVETALPVVDDVVVSSDSPLIRDLAESAGAVPIARPRELAQDDSEARDGIHHALEKWEGFADWLPDTVALINCNVPLMTTGDVMRVCERLENDPTIDIAAPAISYHGVVMYGDGTLINYSVGSSSNRQARQEQWEMVGSVRAFRPSYLDQPWLSGKLGLVKAERQTRLEIDTMEDLQHARLVVPW